MQILGKKLDGSRLIGTPELFSLEERIFNTVCIIAFITMCFEVPFNFFIGLAVPAGLCIFGVVFSAYMYYLSRFRRKSSLGIKVFCIVCNLAFAINYFYNSGVYGPNLLLFSLVFLMVIAVIPKTHFKIWIPINILLVFVILTVEYFYPNAAPDVYISRLSKVIDFGVTYFVVVILTYFAISYIRKNYDAERFSVDEKNKAIEQQKLELERINSEKDKLFSVVTHDIRMPLNSIQSYLELLDGSDLGVEERAQIKKHLLQVTRDTSAMVTNVLSWSKAQMAGSRVDLAPVNVKDALMSGLNIEKSISQRKGVRLEIVSEDNLHIIADYHMFQLVVRNLVSNAIKFTEKGGQVTVSAKRIANVGCIEVRDNGLGISKERQHKLFQLKASSTYGTNKEKGVGLGLLLCKEFTDLQGGTIAFEPNGHKGSVFTLSFALSAN
ncbi:ATP-binding protein [Pedobacter sp. ASV12]|uniref:ATP-binding protein n=1 Tax=Pedobacter sp. ASV12 TaxID=2795120 RepID=UPI0018EADE97|nr:ATP-binding protein [Pedobacter sp. ASV12]